MPEAGARRRGLVAAGALTVGPAAAAAPTAAFTLPADAVTALALAAVAAGAVLARRVGRRPVPGPAAPRWWAASWLTLAGVAVVLELVELAASPRAAHPTLSALLDSADGHPVGRGLAFAVWMALGWYLVWP